MVNDDRWSGEGYLWGFVSSLPVWVIRVWWSLAVVITQRWLVGCILGLGNGLCEGLDALSIMFLCLPSLMSSSVLIYIVSKYELEKTDVVY